MSYNIMIAKSIKDDYASLYQYLTTTTDGETTIASYDTKDELDEKVEKMLNDGGYSKQDFIIVQTIDYTIDATDYTDDDDEDSEESEDADTVDDTDDDTSEDTEDSTTDSTE